VAVPNAGAYADVGLLVDLAQAAEAAGWNGFFLWDHIVFGPEPVIDPWVALTAVALATSRLRLGTLVTPLPRRRPWTLARQTVTLDRLSGGRLILGVGLGGGRWEWDDLGEEADLAVRGAMLDEGLAVLAGLWSGQPFHYEGQHYRLAETVFRPPPLQTPRIPIWVAGTWPKRRPFRRAARWDGVHPKLAGQGLDATLTPDHLSQLVAFVRAQRVDPTPFDVVISGVTPGADPARAAAHVAGFAAVGLTWWLETVRWRGRSPWESGRDQDWRGAWPPSAMHRRILQGPPPF
jgi:alkanesulfonate monooxygenase SsuD/methylene tetrahydromethanopterin reductase-like flavin-dependent oxidoreductase (luciferase family)